jgi:hypothetical protein
MTGGLATAADYCEEALAIAHAAGDKHLVGDVLYIQTLVLLHRGIPAPRFRSPSRGWAWPAAFVLSQHTVHRHLSNILRKLGLSCRAAAAAWAARAGLA